MEYSERKLQKILMNWLLRYRNHRVTIPNSTTLFRWEADIASVTKAGYVHEIEIKISRADFARDKKKEWKHFCLQESRTLPRNYTTPNYFWYCTPEGIEIDVPEYAGWLVVAPWGKAQHIVTEHKPAPRLHTVKVTDARLVDVAHLLSFRLLSEMSNEAT